MNSQMTVETVKTNGALSAKKFLFNVCLSE